MTKLKKVDLSNNAFDFSANTNNRKVLDVLYNIILKTQQIDKDVFNFSNQNIFGHYPDKLEDLKLNVNQLERYNLKIYW